MDELGLCLGPAALHHLGGQAGKVNLGLAEAQPLPNVQVLLAQQVVGPAALLALRGHALHRLP